MEFLFTLAVLLTGWTYIRRLENRIEECREEIFTLQQLQEMNLIKDGKEKAKSEESKEAKTT